MKARVYQILKGVVILAAVGLGYAIWCKLTGLYLPCVFHEITGLYCPGCGISRMSMSLISFHWSDAFRYNQVLFLLMPVFLLLSISLLIQYIRRGNSKPSQRQRQVLIAINVILVIYGVIRNLPWFDYLRPPL